MLYIVAVLVALAVYMDHFAGMETFHVVAILIAPLGIALYVMARDDLREIDKKA